MDEVDETYIHILIRSGDIYDVSDGVEKERRVMYAYEFTDGASMEII